MDNLYETSRPRVTSDMLPNYMGSLVTILGVVQPDSISPNGDKLKISTKPNGEGLIEVQLRTALNELLEDMVEVTGKVNGQGSVECMEYKALKSESEFDFAAYNMALNFMHNHPDLN